ncbi:DUF397 domain-containing protein [Streptomyces sp. NBC_00111]|uniref:DUF397 domain-containing protein n=1 Tax=Streptomyces sp. NBC_00111 TaxID=2975655 RepID=UPI003248AD57
MEHSENHHAGLTHLCWLKSTYSGNQGDCVEVARPASGVAVRDSTALAGPVLTFAATAWQSFIGEIQADSLAD